MYGTIAKLRVKPGKLEGFREWAEREESRGVPGFISATVYQLDKDPNTLMLVVQFEDKASYHANANDPAQHQSFLKMMEYLDGEPEWNDGEIIAVTTE